MTEVVPVHLKRQRLRDFRAQFAVDRSTREREIYWAGTQQVWIAVEPHPQSGQHVVMSFYKTCPCGGSGAQ